MAISDNAWALGLKLKNIRLKRGMTLAETAAAGGFSPQFLSMVENGKCGISFPKLEALLACYGMNLADLADMSENKLSENMVVHVDQMPKMNEFFDDLDAYLVFDRKLDGDERVNVTLFRLSPGDTTRKWSHKGMEFIFVLDGMLEVVITDPADGQEKHHTLGQWDTLQHKSSMDHYCQNVTTKEVSFLVGTIE